MNAGDLVKGLGGHWHGLYGMARCPAHDDRSPSLSISKADNGRVLVKCFAGCSQAQVIEALRSRGLWEENCCRRLIHPLPRVVTNDQLDRGDVKRTEAALTIWQSAKSAEGTLVETYLGSRGLQFPPPPTLRFHAGLKHLSGDIWPAMIALVTRAKDATPLAIHRTFLARDGSGKAPVDPQKMMLGPCRGGAVRLSPVAPLLLVGEGVETCISAMQISGKPAWAALSAPGLAALELSAEVREIIILADGDEAGERASIIARSRWKNERRRVRIARAPAGQDWNDVLMARGATRIGGVW